MAMTKWHEQIPASSVVDLLPHLHESAAPPAELPIPPRAPLYLRRLVVLLGVVVAVACFGAVVLLWTSDSPGLVVNLVFTIMGAVIGLGVLGGVGSWYTTAAAEELARRDWRSTPPTVPQSGVVVDREVSLNSESGDVNQIQLLVRTGEDEIATCWRSRGRKALLQSQVPGVGSHVRVWRSSAGPVLVEVADPSVVDKQDAR